MHALKCDINDVDCLLSQSAETLQTTFSATNNHNVPTCRDACVISPAVDGKILRTMTAAMFSEARKVPTLSGWCKDDGAGMISYEVKTPGYSMTEK